MTIAACPYDRLRRALAELTDYERETRAPYSRATFDLARMERLCERLGNPERRYPVAHIAGTKGKGSTSALLAAMLRAGGKRVGLYTSPHLVHLGERIAVDGVAATPAELGAAFERLEPALAATVAAGERVTFFDVTTALAFERFAAERVDVAVIEVGLGGRLDSTNVVRPAVTAITSIGLDHTDKLGDTLEAIALEKAGIVKHGVPLVSGVEDGPAARAIALVAEHRGAPLLRRGRSFAAQTTAVTEDGTDLSIRTPRRTYSGAHLRLIGRHMAENAAVAATLAELLEVPEAAVLRGLAEGSIDARFQVVPGSPKVVVDGAHNPDAVERLVEAFEDVYGPARRAVLAFGAMRDKDVARMVGKIARIASAAVASPCGSARELDPAAIRGMFDAAGVPAHAGATPEAALALARDLAGPDGIVLVTGSLYLAGAALRALGVLAAPAEAER